MEKRHNHHHHLYTEGYSHMTINNIEDVEGGQSQQNKINYFQRVKSEEDIDDTLVKYLKNRVKQADLMISHNTENVREHLKKNRSRKNESITTEDRQVITMKKKQLAKENQAQKSKEKEKI